MKRKRTHIPNLQNDFPVDISKKPSTQTRQRTKLPNNKKTGLIEKPGINGQKNQFRDTCPESPEIQDNDSELYEPQTNGMTGMTEDEIRLENEISKFGLTAMERRFVEEWLVDRNGTRAYRAAYPNCKKDSAAAVCASQKLRLPKIKAYIEFSLARLRKRTDIDQAWVLERYRRLLEFHIDDVFDSTGKIKPLETIPMEARYAIQHFKALTSQSATKKKDGTTRVSKSSLQEVKFSDKKAVLDSLARYLGMFGDEGQAGSSFYFGAPVQIKVGITDNE